MELLTQKQAADLLCVSIRTVERYRHSGLLKSIQINKRTIRIPKLAVEKLLGESRWHKSQDLKNLKTINTTSSTEAKTAVNEYQRGRRIYQSQLHGFKAG